jgi:hypothetical protein
MVLGCYLKEIKYLSKFINREELLHIWNELQSKVDLFLADIISASKSEQYNFLS